MPGLSMSENLEAPCTPGRVINGRDAQGRQKPHAWDGRHGESYRLVVRRKLPNKSGSGEPGHAQTEAEAVDGRGRTKARGDQQATLRTQSRHKVCHLRWFTHAGNGPECRAIDPVLLGRPGADVRQTR